MPTQPSPEQIQALFAHAPPGPLVILNLLKFKEKAVYASLESFRNITATPEYQEIGKHREAGLAHQLLVNLKNLA